MRLLGKHINGWDVMIYDICGSWKKTYQSMGRNGLTHGGRKPHILQLETNAFNINKNPKTLLPNSSTMEARIG